MSHLSSLNRLEYEIKIGGYLMTQKWDVVIIGAGLAGYVAANYLINTNLSILVIEKGKHVGGRARTNKIKQQYFNLGPHAFYKRGKARSILEELGIKLIGQSPNLSGGILLENNIEHAAPFSISDVFKTSFLNWKERLEWSTVLLKVMNTDPEKLDELTFQQWVQQVAKSKRVESLLYIMSRLTTYCHAPEEVSAKVIISHLKNGLGGTLYLDGGWQTIIDQLHNHAVLSGIQVQTQTSVKQIEPIPHNQLNLSLSNGEEILAKYIICTTGPSELNNMLGEQLTSDFTQMIPIRGATLDVAFSQLPKPNRLFAMGISEPLYYSVHSHYASLSDHPRSSILHVFKYIHPDDVIDGTEIKNELEKMLDKMQPGWREYVITSRFIPNITVNQRLPKIGDELKLQRFKAVIPGLYIAGDWASPDYILADGATISGKQAALDIISNEKRKKSANFE